MKSKPNNAELYQQLKKLIYEKEYKEKECAKYLEYTRHILFKETVINYEYLKTEYRGTTGDSDFIISGTVETEAMIERVHAYIWELKAPQCYQFEYDNDYRICPTQELIKAENQLLWYYHDQKGSETFRRKFNVDPNHIYCGGIIIGCDQTLVKDQKNKYDEVTKRKLYEDAITIRGYFYNQNKIKLMSWSYVLRQFDVEERKNEDIGGAIFPVVES